MEKYDGRSQDNSNRKIINGGVVVSIGSAPSLSEQGPTIVNSLLSDVVYAPSAQKVELFDEDKAEPTLDGDFHPLEAVALTEIRVRAENAQNSLEERYKKFSQLILRLGNE